MNIHPTMVRVNMLSRPFEPSAHHTVIQGPRKHGTRRAKDRVGNGAISYIGPAGGRTQQKASGSDLTDRPSRNKVVANGGSDIPRPLVHALQPRWIAEVQMRRYNRVRG